MAALQQFTVDAAQHIGTALGIDWQQVDIEQFRRGIEVAFEHGLCDLETDVTRDDLNLTGKIAWAHLKEYPDYYTRLITMEAEAKAYWQTRR